MLAAKLNNERMLELQSTDPDKVAAINEFLDNSPWQIQDKSGTHEFTLVRDFGNEKQVAPCFPCLLEIDSNTRAGSRSSSASANSAISPPTTSRAWTKMERSTTRQTMTWKRELSINPG